MIGHLYCTVLDCPDPKALARFYAELLGMAITKGDDDWVEISDGTTRVCFQRAPDHQPPRWPDPAFPQQLHLDVHVADVVVAEQQVLAIDGRRCPDRARAFACTPTQPGIPSAWCSAWSRPTPTSAIGGSVRECADSH